MNKINKEKHSVYLSTDIIDKLERLKFKYGFNYFRDAELEKRFVRKSKTTLSAFLKSIIINTHTYFENFTFSTDKEISALLKLDQFKEIKSKYNKALKDEKFRNFIKELIKYQTIDNYTSILNALSMDDMFQFRTDSYTAYDFETLSAYIKNPDFPYKKIDYFNFLVYFFTNASELIQDEIMYHPVITKINTAFYNQTSIKINKSIIKPYSIIKHTLTNDQTLVGVDNYNKEIKLIPFSLIYEIEDFGVKNRLSDEEINKLSDIVKQIKNNNSSEFIEIESENIDDIKNLISKSHGINISSTGEKRYNIDLYPLHILDIIKFKKTYKLINSSSNIVNLINLIVK
jgi:hypothetical protein